MTQTITQEFIAKNGHEKIVIKNPIDVNPEMRVLVATSTREPFMPARLYFRFLKKNALIKALDRRQCIDWQDENNFNINYWEETRNMELSVPCDEVPDELYPVLLARGQIVGCSEVYIDVRSFARAIGILKFLNKYIGPQFMYVTHIATYNRYISFGEEGFEDIINLDFNELFSEENLQKSIPEMREPEREDFQEEDGLEFSQAQWEEIMDEAIPAVRKIPVIGTKAGIARLQLSLGFSLLIAEECWEEFNNF